MNRGILLFGHGARNPEWARPFSRIEALLRQRLPELPVCCGYLELMQPSFDEAVDHLVASGATRIQVVPIFMAAGGHVKQDLPRMADAAAARHAGLQISLSAPVGESEAVLGAMADFALAELAQTPND